MVANKTNGKLSRLPKPTKIDDTQVLVVYIYIYTKHYALFI